VVQAHLEEEYIANLRPLLLQADQPDPFSDPTQPTVTSVSGEGSESEMVNDIPQELNLEVTLITLNIYIHSYDNPLITP